MRRKKQKLKRYRMQSFLTLDFKKERAEICQEIDKVEALMCNEKLKLSVQMKLRRLKPDVEALKKLVTELKAYEQRLLTTNECLDMLMKVLSGTYHMMVLKRLTDVIMEDETIHNS